MIRDNISVIEKYNISINFPSFKPIALWGLLFVIILPWLYVLSKLNIFEEINSIFERLLSLSSNDEKDSPKKNGIFY